MRVLVTGASGFVGGSVLQALAPRHEVWALSRSERTPARGVTWIAWDMLQPLAAGLLPARLDAIVHLAQSRDYRSFPEKAVAIARVNVDATLELLEHGRRAGIERFVFTSSGGVYGGARAALAESAPVKPPDFYLATKAAAEALASAYCGYFDVVTLRLFFPYGAHQSPDRFVARLIRTIQSGDPVVLYGEDGIRVNPIHVTDVARAVEASLAVTGCHVVNIAGPEPLTLREIANAIGECLGKQPRFEMRPPDPARDLVAVTALMAELLGAPSERFRDRIRDVCAEAMAAPL